MAKRDDRLHSHKRCEKQSATTARREAALSNRKAGENEIGVGEKPAAEKSRAKISVTFKKSDGQKSVRSQKIGLAKNHRRTKNLPLGKIGSARSRHLEKSSCEKIPIEKVAKKSRAEKSGPPKKSVRQKISQLEKCTSRKIGRAKNREAIGKKSSAEKVAAVKIGAAKNLRPGENHHPGKNRPAMKIVTADAKQPACKNRPTARMKQARKKKSHPPATGF